MSKIKKSSIRNVIVNFAVGLCMVNLGMVMVGLADAVCSDLDWYGMLGWFCGFVVSGLLVYVTQVWDDLKDHEQ